MVSYQPCTFIFSRNSVSSCVSSQQYLTCLKTSRSQTDKLSFDVGLQEDSIGKLHYPTLLHYTTLLHLASLNGIGSGWRVVAGWLLLRWNHGPKEKQLFGYCRASSGGWHLNYCTKKKQSHLSNGCDASSDSTRHPDWLQLTLLFLCFVPPRIEALNQPKDIRRPFEAAPLSFSRQMIHLILIIETILCYQRIIGLQSLKWYQRMFLGVWSWLPVYRINELIIKCVYIG